jgi:hypothetical protein
MAGRKYVFIYRRRQRAKVIWFDRTGYGMLAKRLGPRERDQRDQDSPGDPGDA